MKMKLTAWIEVEGNHIARGTDIPVAVADALAERGIWIRDDFGDERHLSVFASVEESDEQQTFPA